MSTADDARAVEHLLYRYAELIDAGDFDGVAELFAHGAIHAVPDGPPETVFAGRDAVRGLYERSTRRYEDGTPRSRHLVTNAIVEVDAEAGMASSRSVFTVLQATDALPLQPIVTGRYHDTFHRVDGAWCFATRTMHLDLTGDLSQHLLF
ncbi:nuclear transport factor 2 family protein [Nocardioides fonticola]|uniref:Nuclear transport factor 2 family protein n=1 Tax=Nocardioides fonticola TaxID=450363 RepID=A0ABP7XI86_9ACTN